jgi:hypothetical protein
MISVYQGLSTCIKKPSSSHTLLSFIVADVGAAIMLMSLVLFETEFLNIVSISFTSLVLNELIMVALEITTWYARVFFLP